MSNKLRKNAKILRSFSVNYYSYIIIIDYSLNVPAHACLMTNYYIVITKSLNDSLNCRVGFIICGYIYIDYIFYFGYFIPKIMLKNIFDKSFTCLHI